MIVEIVNAVLGSFVLSEIMLREKTYTKDHLVRTSIHILILVNVLQYFFSVSFHYFSDSPLLSLFIATLAFFTICYKDIQRYSPFLTLDTYIRQIVQVSGYMLPLLPFIAVLLAALVLLLVQLFEFFQYDPHILNTLIYYTVLYGPFISLYWELKRSSISASLLPL